MVVAGSPCFSTGYGNRLQSLRKAQGSGTSTRQKAAMQRLSRVGSRSRKSWIHALAPSGNSQPWVQPDKHSHNMDFHRHLSLRRQAGCRSQLVVSQHHVLALSTLTWASKQYSGISDTASGANRDVRVTFRSTHPSRGFADVPPTVGIGCSIEVWRCGPLPCFVWTDHRPATA